MGKDVYKRQGLDWIKDETFDQSPDFNKKVQADIANIFDYIQYQELFETNGAVSYTHLDVYKRQRLPIKLPRSRLPAPKGSASGTPSHTFSPSQRLKTVQQIKLPRADTSHLYFCCFLESCPDPGASGETAGPVPGGRPVGNDLEMKKLISECAPIILSLIHICG